MDNDVYLLSKNMNLIKCFLNYDSTNSMFSVREVSTISVFDTSIFNKAHCAIVIIDQIGTIDQHFKLINHLRHLSRHMNIKVIYTYPEIDARIIDELKYFKCYKALQQPLDFFYFVSWLQTVQNSIQNTDFFIKEIEVNACLNRLGISNRLLGFLYLKEAVIIKMSQSKMKLIEICDRIAREHQTTSSRVERCMRTAISSSYEKNQTLFLGISIYRRPSCMDFIAKLGNFISIPNKE